LDLHDKIVLITGAKRIGLIAAGELAKRGADVGLSYARSQAEAEEAAARARAAGRRAVTHRADLSDPEGCRELVTAVAASLGGLDVLINMASVYIHRPFADLEPSDWHQSLAVDLSASYFCARAAAPLMRARGGGRIINFSDWLPAGGRPRYRGFLPYYVAKAGVKALTEALALELAGDNILVNAIAPGPILAPPTTSADEYSEVERSTPLGRWGGEMEIVKAIAALIDSDFITGETIRVDGGRHLK
jgi:NAD(P)-dependent dehydrogenase (short-subunit alcohol dehydrogenase family)